MAGGREASRRLTLLAVSITSFLTPFTGSAVNIAVPAIGADLGVDVVTLTWTATGFLLASAAFGLPLGRLADMTSKRLLFMTGTAIFALTSLAAAYVNTAALLIAMRVVQGLGGAFVFSTGMAMLMEAFPASERGKVLGVNAAVVYVGVAAGPSLGGVITHQLGWRYLFAVTGVLAVLSCLAALRIGPRPLPRAAAAFDVHGALLYVTGLSAAMYGMSTAASSRPGAWILLGGLALLALFVRQELREVSPLVELRLLLANRPFAFSNLAALVNYMSTSGVGYLLSVYLQSVRGLTAQGAGLVLLAQAGIMATVSPLSGRLSDRVEPRLVATTGMVLTGAGLVMLEFLTPSTPTVYLVTALLVIGLGYGLFAPPNNNAVMSSVPPRSYGVASSILSTMRLVGQTMSMTLTSLILAAMVGTTAVGALPAGVFMRGMKAAVGVFAACCVAGAFASMARGKVLQEP
ncbi:MAG: MFS transporter [Syntrophomonadaceae bacterium]|nr:MFS transporter [Syntrophomonadaceae bacterium]